LSGRYGEIKTTKEMTYKTKEKNDAIRIARIRIINSPDQTERLLSNLWDAALEWAAENAKLKEVSSIAKEGSYLAIDEFSILKGKK
jgi:hypothetical protein